MFPRQEPGRDYSLNWSLCSSGIVPWGNCYGRPTSELLMKELNQSPSENNLLKFSKIYSDNSEIKVADLEILGDTV